jgi:hypothetical protein
MRLVRTILAFAIAASLALLPVGASAVGVAMSSGDVYSSMHDSSMQMGASSDISMDDCCPDDMKGAPADTGGHKCGMGFCCISGIVALGDISGARFEFHPASATGVAIPADQVLSSRDSSPPFRPPRV